jgi:hypothetical protein
MKNLILIMMVVCLGLTANAQKYYSLPANDTIVAESLYFPLAAGYDLKNVESGAFSFTFTHTDVADSLSVAAIQYSNDRTTWTSYTGNAALTTTTTDGQSRIYISTPLVDRYVRAILTAATGDSVALTGMVLMLKED